jgi:cell volume regulation protein A
MISFEYILAGSAILLLLSIIVSRASGRLGVPALLIFLAIGMLAGSDGPGGIYFDNARLAQALGVVALVLILFAGGLETRWERVRPVLRRGLVLSTLGVFTTALLVAAFVKYVLQFTWLEGLLLGSVVSSTDAAAVFAVLRSRSVSLKGELEQLLELESGSNDPMAIFLTIALIQLQLTPGASLLALVPMFFLQMGLGAALGYAMGRAMKFILNNLKLEYDGLYPVLLLALALLTYGLTEIAGGNGFLAAYLAAIVLGNSDFIHKRSLIRFHDGLAWLMQIVMFLTLGLLVFPHALVPILGTGLLVSLFLVFVARPISVYLSLLPFRMNWREKTMVAWVGLRGAAPIILATFPLLAGAPRADMYFNLVFFIVLVSSVLQGPTIPRLAKWLGVDAPLSAKRKIPLEYEPTGKTRSDLVEIIIPKFSAIANRRVLELGFPTGSLVVLIIRGEETIVPAGGTVIQEGDELLMFADKEELAKIEEIISAKEKTAEPEFSQTPA